MKVKTLVRILVSVSFFELLEAIKLGSLPWYPFSERSCLFTTLRMRKLRLHLCLIKLQKRIHLTFALLRLKKEIIIILHNTYFYIKFELFKP